MKLTRPAIAAGATVLIISIAGGVALAKGGKRGGFTFLDTNGDGSITRAEITAAASARFAEADTNGDGNLTLAEIEAMDSQGKRKPARMFSRLDANGDDVLTEAEFLANPRMERMFERLDANADGTITAEEMQNMRRGGRDSASVNG